MTVGAEVKGVYYTIKNIEASLEQLSLKTNDENIKLVFTEANELVREVKTDLQKQVQFLAREEPQY